MNEQVTIEALAGDALATYERLQELAEEVEDEWSYIQDLTAAWRERIGAMTEARGDEPATTEQAAAIERTADEAERITDPHRAIDWLSTFPQIVVIAFEERP